MQDDTCNELQRAIDHLNVAAAILSKARGKSLTELEDEQTGEAMENAMGAARLAKSAMGLRQACA